MSLNRAWTRFQIKNISDDRRTFSGWASTPSLDLAGDRIDPLGVCYTLPLPLLWNHDAGRPVGSVVAATVKPEGIHIHAQIASVSEPVSLKEELDRAWAMVKSKLVGGLSVGFRTLQEHPIATGFHITEWRLLEISCVAIPANSDCSITAIKNADRAASTRGSALSSSSAQRMASRLDPGVVTARRQRLLRAARADERERTMMQFFSSLE